MITSAACRAVINNNEVVTIKCHRHCDFFEIMKLLHIDYDKSSVEQGFINWDKDTRTETFVDRYEAYQIALTEQQLFSTLHVVPLYTEDLW